MKTLLLALCALTVVASAEPCQKERTLVGKNALVRDGSGRIAGTASTSVRRQLTCPFICVSLYL